MKAKLLLLVSVVLTLEDWDKALDSFHCNAEECPDFVILVYKHSGKAFCGASLVTTRWIVTAPTCGVGALSNISNAALYYRQIHYLEDNEQRIDIDKVVVHNAWGKYEYIWWLSVHRSTNNICLMKLRTDIKSSNKVKISKIADDQFSQMIENGGCSNSIMMRQSGYTTTSTKRYSAICNNVNLSGTCKNLFPEKDFLCGRIMHTKPLTNCYVPYHGTPLYCKGVLIGLYVTSGWCNKRSRFHSTRIYCRVSWFQDFILDIISRPEDTEPTVPTLPIIPIIPGPMLVGPRPILTSTNVTDSKTPRSAFPRMRDLFTFIFVVHMISG